AWIMAGVMTVCGSQCGAELSAMLPRAGGQYVYLREAYGSAVGFLFGWTLSFVVQTGKIAALAIAFASFTGVLISWVSPTNFVVEPLRFGNYAITLSTQQLVAIASIVLLSVVNIGGLAAGKRVQNALTAIKTVALLGLIAVGLTLGWNRGSAAFTSSWWNPWANGWTPAQVQPGLAASGTLALMLLFGKAMVGPLFSQSGWNNVTFTGGEIRDPGRNLPAALLKGTTVVVALYLLANLAYVVTLPLDAIQGAPQNRVATALMQTIFGAPGAVIMAAAIMVSTFGCNNGLILAGARVTYAMACDGLFFSAAGRVNARHVPAAALALQCIWASLLTLPRTVRIDAATGAATYGNVYTQLLEFIIPADLLFYALLAGAVIVMRRRQPHMERPYRTFGYPITPLIYIVIAAMLIADLTYLAPATAGIGGLIVLSGIPVFLLWRRRAAVHTQHEGRGIL
ncbi:MAG TPA: amino acid permease, partial [Longimicrobiales bacterium]